MTAKNSSNQKIKFGQTRLTIENIVAISEGVGAEMNSSPEFTAKIDRGVAFLERLLKEDG
ncbi:MAG TPA: histidine ammonia-lyase, partial [Psychromonas hadalis]|nr:histidine ammonia-lyase [Psychromonas hadalis]